MSMVALRDEGMVSFLRHPKLGSGSVDVRISIMLEAELNSA